MSLSTPKLVFFLIFFYSTLTIFALSDLKRFIFHVHISRVDRVPLEVDVDTTSSLWYPITVGIIFNLFIVVCSSFNLILLLAHRTCARRLFHCTLIVFIVFTVRFIIDLVMTRTRNGFSTPTLVERSFVAASLSLEEELASIIIDWLIKLVGFLVTFYVCYQYKEQQTMSIERKRENQLMENFD